MSEQLMHFLDQFDEGGLPIGGVLADSGLARAVILPQFSYVDFTGATMKESSILCPACGERNLIGVADAHVSDSEIISGPLYYVPHLDSLPGDYKSGEIKPPLKPIDLVYVCPSIEDCGFNTLSPLQA